jgi:hypothetical protein
MPLAARCVLQETELAAKDPEKYQDLVYQWRNATQRFPPPGY